MKKEDLMIGDWVNIQTEKDDEPMYSQVEQLWECEIDADFETNYENVHPIPLTEEILEKNGFKKNEKGLYRISGDIVFNIHSYRLDMYNYDSEYLPYIKICDCKYVHELQHMIKMCDIEKEIIL